MKNLVLLDILFYFVFPVVIWNMSKDPIGDYYAMLLSAIPGILYTIVRIIKTRRINTIGLFILTTLIISTTIDLISGSGLNLLWNNVYYQVVLAVFFIVTILINKPIVLYFSLDFTDLQGFDRNTMKSRFYQKDVIAIFRLITLGFGLRSAILACIKGGFILKYGVEAFDEGLMVENIFSWGMSGLCFYGLFLINNKLNQPQHKTSIHKV